MKNTLKILMCIILALTFIFGGIVACDNTPDESSEQSESSEKEEESSEKEQEPIIITFDYDDWDDVDCDEDERELEPGKKIGTLPKPTLSGYTFKGWFTEEDYASLQDDPEADVDKVKTSWKPDEDTVLFAWFVEDTEGDDSGSGTGTADCSKGIHSWTYDEVPATCDKAGSLTKRCEVCKEREIDVLYAQQNKALGHQWIEEGAIDDGGWTYIGLARQRTCKRDGCGKTETKQLKNITSLTSMTVQLAAGAWPETSAWPGNLTDGKWDTGPNGNGCAPKGGGPLTITMLFNTPSEIDQIAISCVGLGDKDEGTSSAFDVYLWYAAEEDFREEASNSGYLSSTNGTRETAYCIDRTMDDQPLLGIKIVFKKTLNGVEYFREIALGQTVDEEE